MLRGLWKLTWIEIKIFLREPLGAIGSIAIPVLVFLVAGRMVGRRTAPSNVRSWTRTHATDRNRLVRGRASTGSWSRVEFDHHGSERLVPADGRIAG